MTKIMLVEDDNSLREIYEARLAAEGYQIVTAKDGEEALAVAAKERPELVISDVMMPKISGFEMLDILRNTDGLKNVKVIMLTALSQADDKTRADSLGADRYLVKSQVTLEDIVNAARDLVENKADIASQVHSSPVSGPSVTPTPTPVAAQPVAVATPPVTPTTVAVSPEPAASQDASAATPPADDSVRPAADTAQDTAVAEPPAADTPSASAVQPSAAPIQQIAAVEVPPEEPLPPATPPVQKATPSMPTSMAEEEAFMQAQIDSFVKDTESQNAITAPAAEPVVETDTTQAADTNTAPTHSETESAASQPEEPDSVPIIVTEPANPTSSAPVNQPAVSPALNEAPEPTIIKPNQSMAAPSQSENDTLSDEAEEDVVTSENNPTIAHKKIIQPPTSAVKPDINALLAMEEAKEAAQTPTADIARTTNAGADANATKPDFDPNSISL